MREIQFRGMGINGGWHYGLLTVLKSNHMRIEAGHYISSGMGLPFAYHVRPETVGQYTGLKDKNGIEIFEGDVLKTRNFEVENPFTGRVTLRCGRFAVVYPGCYRQDIGESVWDCTVMGTEIIGNIYENADQFPHLLEGREEA